MPLRESKIAPAFFIGLGGCGGAIVDELARKVKQEDSYDRYRDLVHFFAFDTDADDLSRLAWIDTAHRFLLSDFHKPEYVDLKQGKLHAKADALFTQWWPDYYRPRDTRGKGAGQIRIESRLALYHHLENDRGKILETIEKAIRRAYDIHNPFRANKAAKVYIYASLAGGTGSGGFATMACTMRRLLGGSRGHVMIGTFVLPNVFKAKGLPPNQFDKIMANGYSAMTELELLESASPSAPVEFHYDPDSEERTHVDRPPFDQIYLVEEKTSDGVVIADPSGVYPAIADAAFAQIFSTIVDKEGSTLDNDTRELAQLDEQGFTKAFGSFGISALVLPTQDLLEYTALRLGADLLLAAVPGGAAALGDGTDLDTADDAFARGFEAKAASPGEQGEPFRRSVEWVRGGTGGGEGAIAAFLRRCREDVLKRIDACIKLRTWDEAELSTFEKDPERVQSETAAAWGALAGQITKSEESARAQAAQAAVEVATGKSDLSLAEIARGKGPTETRYLQAVLRQALLAQQEEMRKAYERSLVLTDPRLLEDFKRRVEALRVAAPETFMEKLPGRQNDYFEVAAAFAGWYREVVDGLRWRIRANAMLEFTSAVIKELDRRRTSSFHFFARVDRVLRQLEQRAAKLLAEGGARAAGSDANRFVLDVEVLQDHRTGARLWEHLYRRIVRTSDFQLSGALSRLAEVAGEGGAELDVQRRIIEELLRIASTTLRGRILGDRDERGLRLDEELTFEARLAHARRSLEKTATGLPSPADPAWIEEARRTSQEDIDDYIKDKLEHAASKCKPFVTLSVGAPLLPDKAYVVHHPDYAGVLGQHLSRLQSHRIDRGQVISTEDPHAVIFYYAQLGCPLHAIKSMVEYERRYLSVKTRELGESAKATHLPKGVPQIPIHQDKNWEGAPDAETRLFRISIEGVKENDAKVAYADRVAKRREKHTDVAVASDDLRDFALGSAFGFIAHHPGGAAGEGFYLEDPDLDAERRRLGKFRDQAFAQYRGRVAVQRAWVQRGWEKKLAALLDDRDEAAIKSALDAHEALLTKLTKTADGAGGKPLSEHLAKETAVLAAFRKERGI
ncbi:MAG: tubulin-like doman-containing protein [Polyangiaceae bacterium]